ncbi:DsbA family protein [Haliangium sp.]|uniref:DsbA family protein n=1 Tax=Haliangium sp. TaxID=2663208 RepID=UPI003D125AC5
MSVRMRGRRRLGLGLVALSACAIAWAWTPAPAQAREPRVFDPAQTYLVPLGDGPRRGPDDALVTIVEFSDFICPYCGRVQETLADLERLFPGQIRRVYRHNPLDLDDAGLAAEASMAAGAQGAFWPMHELIFAAGGHPGRAQVEDFAAALGLDVGRFRRDLDQHRHRPAIEADAASAEHLGVYSTPSFFINGRPVVGAMPLEVFARIVEEELARARALVAQGVAAAEVYDAVTAGGLAQGARPEDAPDEFDPRYRPTALDSASLYEVGDGLPGHALGPADAPLTVVVFSDFECPYCARLHPTLQELRAVYGDRVRVVLRHLPLSFHPRAQLAAEAAVAAAAQGRLWAFYDRVFAEPEALSRADLERHARAAGLDMDRFRAALDDRRYFEQVAADAAAGKALGVRGTPTMFVNGTPIPGAAPFDVLDRHVFRPKMAEAEALIAAGVAPAAVYRALLEQVGGDDVAGRERPVVGAAVGAAAGDPGTGRAALLQACRARDDARAQRLYRQMGTPAPPGVRVQCRPFGVDLP